MQHRLVLSTALFALASFSLTAGAHFPWLTIDDDGKATYFFGETPADRTYKLPSSISKAQMFFAVTNGRLSDVELSNIESDSFVGLKSVSSIPKDARVTSKVTYGVYHGSRLDYFTQHLGGKLPADRAAYKDSSLRLDLSADVIDTDSGVDVFVTWKGEPLADAEVRLFCEEGHEEGNAKTDADGKISFGDKQVEEGLNGILVGHTAKGEAGKVGDQPYESVSSYLTATFVDPESYVQEESNATVSVSSESFPQIPELVTSFGAAITNDSLYLYGGHTGGAHDYHAEAQANTLWKLDLHSPKSWESMGNGPRLQGLAMVAHAGKLYRIGGFTAKNKEGEKKDLWSQAGVACFDPTTKEWSDLPSLPEPRSSFDAAVLGDRIYVMGGWSMKGGDESTWLETAHVMDLSEKPLRWQTLPTPPFQRRALSVAAHNDNVYAVGGMQQTGGPSTRVDVFNTKSQTWSRGPAVNGEGMDGFGSSAFAVGGNLYVTTYSGSLQRLADDGKSWTRLHQLKRERFFHRMLPLSENELLTVGGASMSVGKFEQVDVIRVD